MAGRTYRRLGVLAAAIAAALTLAAAPALAHFCSKSGWSEAALAHAPNSNAWLTAAEWNEFIDDAVAADEICQAGADNLKAQIASRPADTLFLGPGLLAGGAEFKASPNAKGPSHFDYLDFETAFAACAT